MIILVYVSTYTHMCLNVKFLRQSHEHSVELIFQVYSSRMCVVNNFLNLYL